MYKDETKVTNSQASFDVSKFHWTPTVLPNAQSEYRAPVEVFKVPITWLADAIEDAVIEARQGRRDSGLSAHILPSCLCEQDGENKVPSISKVIVASIEVAVGARIEQVSGSTLRFDKRNFEYVAVIEGVLGKYGKYVNQEKAYTIYPQMGTELVGDLEAVGALNNGKFTIPSWYPEAMRMCRRAGLFTGYGLPKDTTVDSPEMFKITREDDMIVGVDTGVGADYILTATLVYASELTELFGSYRTLYTGISAARTAIEDLGYKALHNLRHA